MAHLFVKDPDEVNAIINDPERLKSHPTMPNLVHAHSKKQKKEDLFVLNLPHDEIKQWILEEKEKVFSSVPDEVKSKLRWEHVGSTSIPGMPGSMFPDSLILTQSFPPPKEVATSLLANGYDFIGSGPLDSEDVWFIKFGIAKPGHVLDGKLHKIHVAPNSERGSGRLLVEFRDRCNTDKEAFESYKKSKMEAAKHLDSETPNPMAYKTSKSKCSVLLDLGAKYGLNGVALKAVRKQVAEEAAAAANQPSS